MENFLENKTLDANDEKNWMDFSITYGNKASVMTEKTATLSPGSRMHNSEGREDIKRHRLQK